MTADPMLEKISNLLAKAEATTFAEEAHAFTEKAQELMQKYAIDQAMLEASRPGMVSKPIMVKIKIPQPYVNSKQRLLSTIAGNNRCKIVYEGDTKTRVVYLFGYESDINWVQELFLSLLIQAHMEMLVPVGVNTKSWKNNFIYGFADEIGRRLREANKRESVSREATTGVGSALVLVDRNKQVVSLRDETFPRLTSGSNPGASSSLGYGEGKQAGGRAGLARNSVSGRKELR